MKYRRNIDNLSYHWQIWRGSMTKYVASLTCVFELADNLPHLQELHLDQRYLIFPVNETNKLSFFSKGLLPQYSAGC